MPQISTGLVIPQAGKIPLGVTVVDDVDEAQEIPINPDQSGHCTWEEGEGSAMPVGIPVTVVLHIFACIDLPPHWK